jgi:hypothetical protein
MKKLALVAMILLASCSASNTLEPTPDLRLTQLEEKSRIVAVRERQCIDETLTWSRDKMAGIGATSDASVELQTQRETRERDRDLLECRARADQEKADIYSHERDEYQLQAQQEHDRAALMMILTTSQPR